MDQTSWALECTVLEHLAGKWDKPDHGIWERRGDGKHYVSSKVMTWVAFDRGIKSAGETMQLADDVWLLRAFGTAGSVRKHLFQHMGARDTLMVLQLDAVRTATQNFGPEMDARVRTMLYLEAAVPLAASA